MNRKKATGPDGIVKKILSILDYFGIAEIINRIFNSDNMPEKISRSISIAMPQKPGEKEDASNRIISLMSHMIKLFTRTLMNNLAELNRKNDKKKRVTSVKTLELEKRSLLWEC